MRYLPILVVLGLASLSVVFSIPLHHAHLRTVHEDPPLERAVQIVQYLQLRGPLPDLTSGEALHMRDVRRLVWGLALVTVLAGMYMLHHWPDMACTGSAVILVILALVASALPFAQLFTWFHHVAFPQGNWLFSPDSVLITTYPLAFFRLMAVSLGRRILFGAGILLVLDGLEKYI